MQGITYIIKTLAILFVGTFSGSVVIAAPGSDDQVYLHYDVAPDRDDLHAITAGKLLVDRAGIAPRVIVGTHTHHSSGSSYTYRKNEAIAMSDHVYGRGNYREVGYNHAAHFDVVAAEWDAVISRGGTVYVAEGGTSDFTYGVLMAMAQNKKKVTVVQHSNWNERMTAQSALAYVKANANYIKIEDGNHNNSTADLNVTGSQANRNVMLATSDTWKLAFNFYSNLVDFSDTVELLHILSIPKSAVNNIQSFANYVRQSPAAQTSTTQAGNTQTNTTTTILIQAEDYTSLYNGTANKAWIKRSQSGEVGMQLLPDTRRTHSDPLIAGTNFWNYPNSTTPYLTYSIYVPVSGRYLVETRAFSSGTEDNGAHLAVNGNWALQRIQWCSGKNSWTYTSALRLNNNHCGVQKSAFVNLTAGNQEIWLGAREDGLFVDKIRLSLNGIVSAPVNNISPIAAPSGTPSAPSASSQTDHCAVAAPTLSQARDEYAQQCKQPRLDCDLVGDQWICGSFNNPLVATEGPEETPSPLPILVPVNPQPESPSQGSTSDNSPSEEEANSESDSVSDQNAATKPLGDTCVSAGSSLQAAKDSYAQRCSLPRVDCDPIGGGTWKCASYQIGHAAPGS